MKIPNETRLGGMIEWPGVLSAWASLGNDLAFVRSRSAVDWNAVNRMIEAVIPKLAAEAEQLKVLLTESRKRLAPLEDPFDLDLGLHRWLDGEREEAYSDWLEWVIGQAKTPERIYALFGLGPPPDELRGCPDPEIRRECCVPHGHIDREGRLDLVIRFGNRAIIVVEVKTGDADAADTAKQKGYCRWIARQASAHKHAVFLATSAEEQIYEGFSFLSWQNVCISMRRLAIDLAKDGRMMAAAMILAFVAAVEQNLLGFSVQLVRKICEGRASFFNPQVVKHLERCLNP